MAQQYPPPDYALANDIALRQEGPLPSLMNACGRARSAWLKPVISTHILTGFQTETPRGSQEGVADVLVLVDKDGVAREVSVVESTGSPTLDQRSINAVKDRWRWETPPAECASMGAVVGVELNWTFSPGRSYQRIFLDQPVYPDAARQAGTGGKGSMVILVDQSGKVIDAKVGKSAGSPELDQAMMIVAKGTTFPPPGGRYQDRQQRDLRIEFVPRKSPLTSRDGIAAMADMMRGVENRPDNGPALVVRSQINAQSGRIDEAIADATQALKIMPGDATANYVLGFAYLRKGEDAAAIKNLSAAVDSNPALGPSVYSMRSVAYVNVGQADLAFADATKALAIQPDLDAYLARAAASGMTGKYDQVIADATQALQLDPASGRAYFLRGMGYSAKNQPDPAIADASNAITLDKKNDRAYLLRANAYRQLKRFDAAVSDYDLAIALRPAPESYFDRAVNYAQKGDKAKAYADIAKVAELTPDSVNSYALKGQLLESDGKRAEAIEAYRAILKLPPAEPGTTMAKAALARLGVKS